MNWEKGARYQAVFIAEWFVGDTWTGRPVVDQDDRVVVFDTGDEAKAIAAELNAVLGAMVDVELAELLRGAS